MWSSRLISELNATDLRATALARGLSPTQLNWQPKPGAWSIGQCLDHLRGGNELVISAISEALKGRQPKPVDEIHPGRITQWFIRSFIAENPGGVRARAPKKIDPPPQVDPDILDAFLRTTEAARAMVKQSASYDVNRIRYKNPFVPLLRFTVGAGFEIIAKHAGRHLLQAEAVKQSPGFPVNHAN